MAETLTGGEIGLIVLLSLSGIVLFLKYFARLPGSPGGFKPITWKSIEPERVRGVTVARTISFAYLVAAYLYIAIDLEGAYVFTKYTTWTLLLLIVGYYGMLLGRRDKHDEYSPELFAWAAACELALTVVYWTILSPEMIREEKDGWAKAINFGTISAHGGAFACLVAEFLIAGCYDISSADSTWGDTMWYISAYIYDYAIVQYILTYAFLDGTYPYFFMDPEPWYSAPVYAAGWAWHAACLWFVRWAGASILKQYQYQKQKQKQKRAAAPPVLPAVVHGLVF